MQVQIFYISQKTGWAFATYDENQNQVGEAAYCYYKSTAKTEAIKLAKQQAIQIVKSFDKSGQRFANVVFN